MPGSIDASTRASPNAWLFPPSFLRRRLVGFGPDPTKVTVHSLASRRSFLRRRLLGFVPDPTNGTVHSLAPPRSFLRRRLVGLGQSRDQTSTPLAGERQCVRVGACGRRARPSELLGGLLRPLEEHRPPRAQSTSALQVLSPSKVAGEVKPWVARGTHHTRPARTVAQATPPAPTRTERAVTRVVLIACTSPAHHPTSQGVRG